METQQNRQNMSPFALSPDYQDPGLERYRGNPFIEALPPIMSALEVGAKLAKYPPFDPGLVNKLPELRMHELLVLDEFFVPMERHIELEQWISQNIRAGYAAKNPINLRSGTGLAEAARTKLVSPIPPGIRYVQRSASLTGTSGVGKSYSLDQILSLMNPVIYHSEYISPCRKDLKGVWVGRHQITWMKVECPFDGSPRSFCKALLLEFDKRLGSTFADDFGDKNASVGDMTTRIANEIANNAVGLLVIDEIQNLLNAKTGGVKQLLSLFVEIENRMCIPLLLVGTPKALSVLSAEFRQARRGTGMSGPEWYPPAGTDDDWILFADKLWQYNYLQKGSGGEKMPEEIRDKLFDLTQGISGLAKVLFALAQRRAMNDGSELLTPALLQREYDRSFVLDDRFLTALRKRDFNLLRTMPDIFSERLTQKLSVQAYLFSPSEDSGDSVPSKPEAGYEAVPPVRKGEPKTQQEKKAASPRDCPVKDTLMHLVQEYRGNLKSNYEALKLAGGVIRPQTQ
jgi:hypothetical protein